MMTSGNNLYIIRVKGGPGSGHYGHAGRIGRRGGSSARASITPNPPERDMRQFLRKKGPAKLYHVTSPDVVESIAKQGLIPARSSAAAQDWEGVHSSKATYFHSKPHAAESNMDTDAEMGLDSVYVTVDLPRTEDTARSMLPDEDAYSDPNMGVRSFNEGGAVAVIGGVKPENITGFVFTMPPWHAPMNRRVNLDALKTKLEGMGYKTSWYIPPDDGVDDD